jgi:hypothetical protein
MLSENRPKLPSKAEAKDTLGKPMGNKRNGENKRKVTLRFTASSVVPCSG